MSLHPGVVSLVMERFLTWLTLCRPLMAKSLFCQSLLYYLETSHNVYLSPRTWELVRVGWRENEVPSPGGGSIIWNLSMRAVSSLPFICLFSLLGCVRKFFLYVYLVKGWYGCV